MVRPLVLARGLDPRRYEVHFASAQFDEYMFQGTSFTRWPICSLSLGKFLDSLIPTPGPFYTKAILAKHIAEELRLYGAINPDLVVADMRLSTTVSAPVFGVPCATIVNAHTASWSHRGTRKGFPTQDYPILRLLGPSIRERIFSIAMPMVLRRLAAPVNTLRREHRLPEIGDFIDVCTWGDRLLFPDDPLLAPLKDLAPHETFLGPLLWSPQVPLPEYWDELGRDRPMVYATVGSSGTVDVVPPILKALGDMDIDVILSTAARFTPKNPPDNVKVVDMIPGDLAARKAAVVVCNGGSGPGYQALAEGTPVFGIPSNPDQILAATAIHDAGAGLFLRASTVTPAKIRAAVGHVMNEEHFRQTTQRVAASFARIDPHARFRAVVEDVVALGSTVNGR
ncbi:MAG: glycosyltransferase [Halobacteriota archaeon]